MAFWSYEAKTILGGHRMKSRLGVWVERQKYKLRWVGEETMDG
jgi:hypothetical protein